MTGAFISIFPNQSKHCLCICMCVGVYVGGGGCACARECVCGGGGDGGGKLTMHNFVSLQSKLFCL